MQLIVPPESTFDSQKCKWARKGDFRRQLGVSIKCEVIE